MARFNINNEYLVISGDKGTLNVYSILKKQIINILNYHRRDIKWLSVICHPSDYRIFTSFGYDGRIFIYNIENDNILCCFLLPHKIEIKAGSFSNNGIYLAFLLAPNATLLLLGLGESHKLYSLTPDQQFFTYDYNQLKFDDTGSGFSIAAQEEKPPYMLPNILCNYKTQIYTKYYRGIRRHINDNDYSLYYNNSKTISFLRKLTDIKHYYGDNGNNNGNNLTEEKIMHLQSSIPCFFYGSRIC